MSWKPSGGLHSGISADAAQPRGSRGRRAGFAAVWAGKEFLAAAWIDEQISRPWIAHGLMNNRSPRQQGLGI